MIIKHKTVFKSSCIRNDQLHITLDLSLINYLSKQYIDPQNIDIVNILCWICYIWVLFYINVLM
jgi:hypothetical protein